MSNFQLQNAPGEFCRDDGPAELSKHKPRDLSSHRFPENMLVVFAKLCLKERFIGGLFNKKRIGIDIGLS